MKNNFSSTTVFLSVAIAILLIAVGVLFWQQQQLNDKLASNTKNDTVSEEDVDDGDEAQQNSSSNSTQFDIRSSTRFNEEGNPVTSWSSSNVSVREIEVFKQGEEENDRETLFRIQKTNGMFESPWKVGSLPENTEVVEGEIPSSFQEGMWGVKLIEKDGDKTRLGLSFFTIQ